VTLPKLPATGYPGDDVAVVTMPTGGKIRPDAGDIRVLTGAGQQASHRVLMVGPGDRVRVAFAIRRGASRYWLYFGNADAKAPTPLEIRRGVLLETWINPGSVTRTLRQAERILARAGPLLGRDFIDRIFLGHNLFGPQTRIASVFTGFLIVRNTGEHVFSTSSQDASFLTIDGKLVLDNGGIHPPLRVAAKTAKLNLTKGLHELKLYHLCRGGSPVAVVAWKAPGDRRIWPIPSGSFAPVVVAKPGIMERYGRAAQADFLIAHAGETFMAERYFQRYTFDALTAGVGKPTFHWDFGDGQTSTDRRVDHVYLADGTYAVTLTVAIGGAQLQRVNRLNVTRPWARVTSRKIDPLVDYAKLVATYDFGKLDSGHVGFGIALMERAKMSKAILRAGDSLVKRDSAPAAALSAAMPIYAETLVAAGEPDRATAALLKGAEMTQDPAVRAKLSSLAGEIALATGDGDRAMAIFTQTLKKFSALTTGEPIRRARIGIGDVWRIRGDYDKARAAYKSAPALSKDGFERQAVKRGDLARHAEDYTRRRLYDDAAKALAKWEYEFPLEKIEGYSSLIRVRLELARRRYNKAAEEVEILVRVNPRSNYAPELLMLAAEAYRQLGKRDVARATLQRIVTGYPESPLAAEAAKKIKAGG
jgi:tetratricopeptide (TPR) repeat protein